MVTILRKAVLWKIGIFAVILGWILCYSYDKAMFEFAQSVNSWRVANKFVKKSNYAKAIYNLNRSSLGFVDEIVNLSLLNNSWNFCQFLMIAVS